MYCLQLSLFITLGRIFDHRPGTHTIHTLVNATLGNIHLFPPLPFQPESGELVNQFGWMITLRKLGSRVVPMTFGN